MAVEIRVGATRRFLGCWATIGSASLFSSFSNSPRFPNTLLDGAAVCGALEFGVCGGVVSGRGSGCGCAECVAVTEGTVPSVGVGLLTTPPEGCCKDDCVDTEQVEFERAGLAGGTGAAVVVDALFALAGDCKCVGVGKGVRFATGLLEVAAFCPEEVGPAYGCPNSPGANERAEQKPSEELMISVNPSVDLFWIRMRSQIYLRMKLTKSDL